MKKISAFIVLVFLLNGCSSIQSANSKAQKKITDEKVSPAKVDLSMNSPTDPIEAKSPTEIVLQDETVRVGDHGGDIYLNADQRENQDQLENKKIKIGLNLGPGLYRTINYVSFLKILERKNLAPDIITGTGFGAIVAAMYASGMTPEIIEWSFYKYLKDKNKSKPYEANWVAEIDKAFLIKFKALNIQDTKKKFFLTLYDGKTKKAYFFDKGNIRDLLLLNLRLSNNVAMPKEGPRYSASFEKEVFNARLLKQLGAEFTIAVDSLGKKFDFGSSNEFLIGVYGRIAGRIQQERKNFDYYIPLPLDSMSLDSIKDGPLFLQRSYEFVQKQFPVMSKKIQAKMESMANLGNE